MGATWDVSDEGARAKATGRPCTEQATELGGIIDPEPGQTFPATHMDGRTRIGDRITIAEEGDLIDGN